MPNGLYNWNYKDVIRFLKENGFEYLERRKGSHEAWKSGESGAIVEISLHGTKTFAPGTFKLMIKESKIPEVEWRNWTRGERPYRRKRKQK